MKTLTKQIMPLFLAVFFFFSSAHVASAINIGGLIGSVISSSVQQQQVMKYVNYYDSDGREELFAAYKDSYVAKDDPELNMLLGDVVERLSGTVAKTEVSIIDRPYNYFVVPSKQFNAACGLGHTMFVNEGVFNFVEKNEDMLASVVAHEMVHGQQDHNIKGIKKQMGALFARNVVASQVNSYGGYVLMDIVSVHAINSGITKPNEWEADNLSYSYLTESGYNPGAPAAVWQKVTETADMQPGTRNVFKSILNPSTHPSSKDRRDSFAKKLTEYSNNVVTVDNNTAEIKINGKPFFTPADTKKFTAKVRSYMIAGNLAAVYHQGQIDEISVKDKALIVNGKTILQSYEGDASAEQLANILNQIK